MSPQAFVLRPVRLWDLPTLKRWRSLPAIQSHLRHPTPPSWFDQLRWWWRIRHDPTCRVWAVTYCGMLCGHVGWYYRKYNRAEVSVLVVAEDRELFDSERRLVEGALAHKAREAGLTGLYVEVLSTAPRERHTVFPPYPRSTITADGYSTLYRWSIV